MVSLVLQKLHTLFIIIRGLHENNKYFESSFGAKLARFIALGPSVHFSGSLVSLTLFSNAYIDAAQIILILAADSASNTTLTDSSATDDYIILVKYETIVYVLPNATSQCKIQYIIHFPLHQPLSATTIIISPRPETILVDNSTKTDEFSM